MKDLTEIFKWLGWLPAVATGILFWCMIGASYIPALKWIPRIFWAMLLTHS